MSASEHSKSGTASDAHVVASRSMSLKASAWSGGGALVRLEPVAQRLPLRLRVARRLLQRLLLRHGGEGQRLRLRLPRLLVRLLQPLELRAQV